MKYFALTLIALFLLSACTEDEVNPSEAFQLNYKNQDLQGKIAGEDWTYLYGYAISEPFGTDSSFHTIRILDTLYDSLNCVRFSGDTNSYVIFSFYNEGKFITEGQRKLRFDNSQPQLNLIMKFIYTEEGSTKNKSVSIGAYEILNVDTVNQQVFGRMHVQENDNNRLNGHFRLHYCLP